MFYRISANGNDFIVVDTEKELDEKNYFEIYSPFDGLIILSPSKVADRNFILYNKDGSRAKISGNGLLAATAMLKSIRKLKGETYLFYTDVGFFQGSVENETYSVTFDMPHIISSDSTSAIVNAGNLHYIEVVDVIDPNRLISARDIYPEGINLHQIQRREKDFYLFVSLESGVGFTKCCGSGAVSSFAFLKSLGIIEDRLLLQTLGGIVRVEQKDNKLKYSGHVKIIFEGRRYEEPDLN